MGTFFWKYMQGLLDIIFQKEKGETCNKHFQEQVGKS